METDKAQVLNELCIMLEEASTRSSPHEAICVIDAYLDILKQNHPDLIQASSQFSSMVGSIQCVVSNEPLSMRKTATS
ncbi:MAG: hypothetical protein G8D91_20025 [gamma proteobacterium symbiont of Clathrolucina costata]